jgi:CheY-like chemotaxis protein
MENTIQTTNGDDATKPTSTQKGRVAKRNKWVQLQNKRILIVEDEAMQALHLAVMIEELGAQVVGIATSVQAALAELAVTSFDCVTLDLNLHGFFSLGIVKGLRDMDIPFIICTAYGDIVSDFPDAPVLQKPITEEALAEALSQAMKGR